MTRIAPVALALALLLALAAPAVAQEGPMSRSGIALSAGASSSDIEGGVLIRNTDSRWGFLGGFMGYFRTSSFSSVALEASYVQKGGKDFARLGYIDVPFLIGAVIPTDDDRLNFNFYTGIGIGFKVSCSEDTDGARGLCDRAKSTEWTWPLGLAVVRRSGTGKFFGLDARYSIGISDAFETSAARNRSWQFKAFFGVPLS